MAIPVPVGNNFLETPKPHHHVSRLIVLMVIMGIVVLIIWLWAYIFTPSVPIVVQQSPVASHQPSIADQIVNARSVSLPPATASSLSSQISNAKLKLTTSQKAALSSQFEQ